MLLLLAVQAKAVSCVEDLFHIPEAELNSLIAEIRVEWKNRSLSQEVLDFKVAKIPGTAVDADINYGGFKYKVISHKIDGDNDGLKNDLHYGLIRYPRDFVADGTLYPVLIMSHGGTGGVSPDFVIEFDGRMPDSYIADNFFVVLPSFRGEKVYAESLFAAIGYDDVIFTSGGQKSVLNYDVDDAMTLLKGVLQKIPGVDKARIASYGSSRGGSVALLLEERSRLIDRTVDMYGGTDMFLLESAGISYGCDGIPVDNPVAKNVIEPAVDAYLLEGDLEKGRKILLQSSAVYFLRSIGTLQIHHGDSDDVVDVSHSYRLADAIDEYITGGGTPVPNYELWIYPGGEHSVESLDGHEERVRDFIGEL